jgi:hypothetical protein
MAPTRNVWHTALSSIASKLRSYGYCGAHTQWMPVRKAP